MLSGILLILILFPPTQQNDKIVTCTIVEVNKSVACPEGGNMVLIEFNDALEARQIFDEWRLVAPLLGGRVNPDSPLETKQIKAGDKVKAVIGDNKFREVATCEVRVWRNVKSWRQFREGERIPNTLFTLPDDCQPRNEKR